MNNTLSLVSNWIHRNGLKISVSKMVAIMMTIKRGYRRLHFVLQEDTLELKSHIRYLVIGLSSRLGFKEHIQAVRVKALKTTVVLLRLMSNVGGPRPIKRKLLASVVFSQLIYVAPVWSSSLGHKNHRQLLLGPQHTITLKVASAYRIVSMVAILEVAGTVPVHRMERSRCELSRLRRSGMENARRTADKNVWHWCQQEWDG